MVSLILLTAILLAVFLILYVVRIDGLGSEFSGMRIGYVQHVTSQEWSTSYRLLNGMVSRAILAPADAEGFILEVESTRGSLSVEMTDGAGNIVFSATDIKPGAYEVSMAGAIKVKFTGKDHEGSFSVTCLAPEQE